MNNNGIDDINHMNSFLSIEDIDENNTWFLSQHNHLATNLPLNPNSPQIFQDPNHAHYFETNMGVPDLAFGSHFSTNHDDQTSGFPVENLTLTESDSQPTNLAFNSHYSTNHENQTSNFSMKNLTLTESQPTNLAFNSHYSTNYENQTSNFSMKNFTLTESQPTNLAFNSHYSTNHENQTSNPMKNITLTEPQPTLFPMEHASDTTMGDKGKMINTDDDNSIDFDEFADLIENTEEENEMESDSMDVTNSNAIVGGSSSVSKTRGGYRLGTKKGLPAKNLDSEHRRRKKINDNLYELRSVVPIISKMDKASILGDAIKYLKDLRQNVDKLKLELESTPSTCRPPPISAPTSIPEFSQLTPTVNSPIRIDVTQKGGVVNIHMSCSPKPDLLYSITSTLNNLGLVIQNAMISCFEGFKLEVFRAQQYIEGLDVHPDYIKAVLLQLAEDHGATAV